MIIKGELQIDEYRGVIYFHASETEQIRGHVPTPLRICSLPKPIPNMGDRARAWLVYGFKTNDAGLASLLDGQETETHYAVRSYSSGGEICAIGITLESGDWDDPILLDLHALELEACAARHWLLALFKKHNIERKLEVFLITDFC